MITVTNVIDLLERVHTMLKGVHTDLEDTEHWKLLKDVSQMKTELRKQRRIEK